MSVPLKYRKVLDKVIQMSDLLLEVLDARTPKDTRIPELERKIKNLKKELILVINKSDLVPEDFVEKVKEQFEYEFPTVYVSTKLRKGSRALRRAIKLYAPEKDKVYIGIFGYPNTGKSSLINLLIGRHRTGVSPKPGFTKGMQLLKLSRKFYLIDTPGIYFPQDKISLVIKCGESPEKIDVPELTAKYLFEKLNPSFLEECYNIKFDNFEDFLKKIAKKYNYITKGKLDLRKASIKFLQDWINGKIRGYWL